jgi:hypothetical protein
MTRPVFAGLELLVELAGGAGNKNSTGDAALAIFDALDDACGLAALGTVGALGGVHHLLAICSFGDLGHYFSCFGYEVILAFGMRQSAAGDPEEQSKSF